MSADYRSGPMQVFAMARGELLGPIVSNWPDINASGKYLEYHYKAPNGVEDAKITQAIVNSESLGWSMVFILQARDVNGELIYKPSELETIQTQFPPDEVFRICKEMEAGCRELLAKVSDGDLGNSLPKTQT